jgi:hypothetical protein
MIKFVLLIPIFFLVACSNSGNYGETFNESEAISVDSLVNRFKTEKEFSATISGVVENACHSEGCWLEVQSSSGSLVMVTYKDKAFTLPTGIEGKAVIMKGRAFIDSTSIEELRKVAREEGKPESEVETIQNPEYSLNFEASGLILKDK